MFHFFDAFLYDVSDCAVQSITKRNQEATGHSHASVPFSTPFNSLQQLDLRPGHTLEYRNSALNQCCLCFRSLRTRVTVDMSLDMSRSPQPAGSSKGINEVQVCAKATIRLNPAPPTPHSLTAQRCIGFQRIVSTNFQMCSHGSVRD